MRKALVLLIACFASMVLRAQQLHWTPCDQGLYSGSTTVNAVILVDGVEQYSDQMELAVFCGNECRGTGFAAEFPVTLRYLAMVNVYGENGHMLTFKAYDHAASQELVMDPEVTVTFTEDGSGTLFEPLELNFTLPPVTNTVTGNWSDAAIWSGGAVPGAGDDVAIAEDCTVDQDATVASLAIADGAVLTVQAGITLTVTGNLTNSNAAGLVIKEGGQLLNTSENVAATAEKDIEAYSSTNLGWYTIASPVNNMTIEGSGFLTPNYDLYRYNENPSDGLEWENYKANVPGFTTFENGRGYLYANSNTFSPAFTGTLNYTTVSYEVTYTDRPGEDLKGFNLIGNPYPHNIYKGVGGAIDNANLASGYYTLTGDGAWLMHTYDEAIPPCQGILVMTTETTTLNFTKTNAESTAESSSKDVAGRLKMDVEGENGMDRAVVYFSEGHGLWKIENLVDNMPNLSVRIDTLDYAIAHVDNNIETLDLKFVNTQSGSFTFNFIVEGLDIDYLHLIDRIANVEQDMLQMPEYVFTATGEEGPDRFTLKFTTTYDVTAAANPVEGGSVTGGGTYYHGATATLTASAQQGYTFTNWTKDGAVVSSEPTISFTVIEAGDYVANFTLNTYQMVAVADPEEGGTVTGSGTYSYGQTVTMTATPNPDYIFVNWTEGGEVVSEELSFSYTANSDRQLVAHFINTVGVTEHDALTVAIYPNPVNEKLFVEMGYPANRCEIYTITGALINSYENVGDKFEMEVSDLPNGTYVIRVVFDSMVRNLRFVKQ